LQRIAFVLNRSYASVRTRACRLNVTNKKKSWPEGLVDKAASMIEFGCGPERIFNTILASVDTKRKARSIFRAAKAKYRRDKFNI
jgi:hypothetical protein